MDMSRRARSFAAAATRNELLLDRQLCTAQRDEAHAQIDSMRRVSTKNQSFLSALELGIRQRLLKADASTATMQRPELLGQRDRDSLTQRVRAGTWIRVLFSSCMRVCALTLCVDVLQRDSALLTNQRQLHIDTLKAAQRKESETCTAAPSIPCCDEALTQHNVQIASNRFTPFLSLVADPCREVCLWQFCQWVSPRPVVHVLQEELGLLAHGSLVVEHALQHADVRVQRNFRVLLVDGIAAHT
jgi:hypothetical protein